MKKETKLKVLIVEFIFLVILILTILSLKNIRESYSEPWTVDVNMQRFVISRSVTFLEAEPKEEVLEVHEENGTVTIDGIMTVSKIKTITKDN